MTRGVVVRRRYTFVAGQPADQTVFGPSLLARRVSTEIANQATNVAFSGTDETALIEEYLRRKFRAANLGELLREEKRLASTFRRLRTAGFSAGGSIRVLKRYAAEAERLEDMDDQEHSAS